MQTFKVTFKVNVPVSVKLLKNCRKENKHQFLMLLREEDTASCILCIYDTLNTPSQQKGS